MEIVPFLPTSEPTSAIIMTSIFAGTLHRTGPLVGDHAYRAQHLANASAAVVLAPAGNLHSISEAVHAATELSHKLDDYGKLPLIGAGASSGGLTILQLARTEIVPFAYLSVFDPISMRQYTIRRGLGAYIKHQLWTESHKPTDQENQHPLAAVAGWSLLAGTKAVARAGRDIVENIQTWKTPIAFEHLAHIAVSPNFQDTTVRVELVGQTFTTPSHQTVQNVKRLRSLPETDRPAPFEVVYAPDKYHSYTDDPVRFTETVQQTIALKPLN